ncbi:6935_t:CDS:1, partial [Funneliformis mosseae]
ENPDKYAKYIARKLIPDEISSSRSCKELTEFDKNPHLIKYCHQVFVKN